MLKVLRLIFTFMLVLTAAGVNAQVTTSAISGKVTDEQNETVIGATIVAVHEPSGIHSTVLLPMWMDVTRFRVCVRVVRTSLQCLM